MRKLSAHLQVIRNFQYHITLIFYSLKLSLLLSILIFSFTFINTYLLFGKSWAKYFIKISLVLLFISYSVSFSQTDNLKFEHLTVKDGLSSNTVNCIYQDSQGFMWFGTENGIDKYDGYNFFNYNHDLRDSLTLSDNMVTDIQEDKFWNLWIATQNGLNRLDLSTGKFEHFFNEKNNPNSLSANIINALFIDKENTIWIGNAQGLDKINIESKNDNITYKFINYRIDNTKTDSYNNIITVIYEDKDGLLWIGTMNGLFSFDKNSETFTPYLYDPENPNSISSNHIIKIYEDKNNYLWISTGYVRESGTFVPDKSGLLNRYKKKTKQFTRFERNDDPYYISYVSSVVEDQTGTLWFGAMENHGLYRYVEKSNQFIRYGHSQNNPYSISSNFVTDLYTDKTGIIWIATLQGGISKYDPNKEKFLHFEHLPGQVNSLHFNNVTRIIEDSFGKVWIGTLGKKIGFYDLNTGLFEKYRFLQYYGGKPLKDSRNLSSPWIMDILEDKSNNIWIGTVIGLNKYDRVTKTYKKYFEKPGDPNDPNFISSSQIICIFQDSRNYLWIGTPNGLNRMDIETETFKHYFSNISDSTTISTNEIYCIHEGKNGDLWFGGFGGGLNLYDRNNDQFQRYLHDPLDINSLSDNRVCVITDDKLGNIWIGTMMGLNKFDKTAQKFTLYTTKDGLCNNYVVGILEDNNGSLWISTKNGLSKFDPRVQTFRNYDVLDGLQSNEFNKLSYHKGRSGRFYFGGINGFNMFYPDSIKDNFCIPPVLITSIKISHKPVELDQSIFVTKSIKLSHFENDISFDYVALSYMNSHKNQYAYQLKGYDDTWNYCGTQRFASYTNLDPGEYTFRVKGSNNDGIWNEQGASINIIITPPWWRTATAYISYVLLFFVILYGLWKAQLTRLRTRHQFEMEHFEAEKLREIDTMKSHFFANISHEFRTPLTLILSPIEQLINDNFKGSIKEGYVTIRSNAKKLLRLVNQLLSLSKMEAGQIKLQVSEQDIIPLFKRIINLFSSLAQRKNINLNFSSPKSLKIYFDEEKLETILNNLLSNAFKFTPEGGDVEVAVDKNTGNKELQITANDFLEIKISNTGPGIPRPQLNKIFDRFYQIESNTHVEGTGIGLSLTKDFVELHHGEISVESKAGKTTVFTILIPSNKEYYNSEEIAKLGEEHNRIEETHSEIELPEIEIDKTSTQELPKALIVEDNEEMRGYLRKNLEENYNIFEASNGKIGIQKAQKELPEIIISDVMMPQMDGIEFCDKIKSEIATNHIPVILLTARAGREDKLKGLKTGADEYLAKPFDLEELSVRIENIIQQRRGLKERFLREALFGIDRIIFHSAEKEFIEKITQIINQNIDNAEYSVDDFAKDIGVSRAHLFRKMKNWTNLTPHDFIRLCRLKKAALMLKDKSHNVTEVAFAVGFKSVSHFSKAFFKQFNQTPSSFFKS